MRIRSTLLVLVSALALEIADAAALEKEPPDGVKLTGTWELVPGRSDNPAAALKRAEQSEIAKRRDQIESRAQRPDVRMPGDSHGRRNPVPDRGDRSRTVPSSGSTDIRSGKTRSGSASEDFLQSLNPNPETLTIEDRKDRVSVMADYSEIDCTTGEVHPVSDGLGDGERQCGWKGRTWVIETTRVERFKRTDSFELSNDGETLVYTSTASGSKIPTVKVSRTYTLVQ